MIHPKDDDILFLAQSLMSSLNGCSDKHFWQNETMSHSFTLWGGTLIEKKRGVEESERKVFSVVYNAVRQ